MMSTSTKPVGSMVNLASKDEANVRRAMRFIFRGRQVELETFRPTQTLLDWLRRDAGATGSKEGCGAGDCGACTVVLHRNCDGHPSFSPVNACILLLGQVDGAEVLTIEDLAEGDDLHPVQEALIARHASQCGFCTPGIAMSLLALHQSASRPVSRETALDALAGNLCRCTGYRSIVDAALDACAKEAGAAFRARLEASATALKLMEVNGDLFLGDADTFFAAPASESTFADLVARHPDAVIIGGATDFGLRVTKELAQPSKIVLIGRVAELRTIETGVDNFSIGAAVTIAEAASALAAMAPDLGELIRRFGSLQVRASGTIGGNIASGSPVGDFPPTLIALGAQLELRRGQEVRTLPLQSFFLAYEKQDKLAGEYVRRVIVPRLRPSEAFRVFKLSKRFDGDVSTVLGAFKISIEARRIVGARIAYGAMAGTPARARHAEAALIGADLDEEESWRAALDALGEDFSPVTDHRASAGYRALAARNLLTKALIEIADPCAPTRIVGLRGAMR